jgi:hypothetical protein
MEVTKWLKPLVSVSRYTVSAHSDHSERRHDILKCEARPFVRWRKQSGEQPRSHPILHSRDPCKRGARLQL